MRAKDVVLTLFCATVPAVAFSGPTVLPASDFGGFAEAALLGSFAVSQGQGMVLAQAAENASPQKATRKGAVKKRSSRKTTAKPKGEVRSAERPDDASIDKADGNVTNTISGSADEGAGGESKAAASEADAGKPADHGTAVRRRETPAEKSHGFGFARDRGGVSVSFGLRSDKLDFNIASPTGSPNVLSELEFDLGDMPELRLAGNWVVFKGLFVSAEYAYARANDGEVRDSDYFGDNRTNEFSRSYSKLKGSTATRYSLGTGWRFTPHRIVAVAPMFGYAWVEQNMRIKKGVQTIDYFGPTPSPIIGLDSRYKPRWRGPWLGVQADVRATDRLDFQVSVKHQWFKYRAEGDWNLRTDFAHPSFRHTGNSQGWQLGAGAAWRFTEHHAVIAGVDWSKQRLNGGKDRTFFADGTSSSTRLNRVNAESWGVNLGYRFSF